MAHNPLLGSRISLISKKNIRYEGTLYSINESDATVALQNVCAYGTEGRESQVQGDTYVSPQDQIHPYLLFRGCDIKDLHVHDKISETLYATDATTDSAPLKESNHQKNQSHKSKMKQPKSDDSVVDKESDSVANYVLKKEDPTFDSSHSILSNEESYNKSTATEIASKSGDHCTEPNIYAYKRISRKSKASSGQLRRTKNNRSSKEMVGSGASLLNLKVRGVVEGMKGPEKELGKDFDFQSNLAIFAQDSDDSDDSEELEPEEGTYLGTYSKNSFFDSISNDVTDRAIGIDQRLRGQQERALNAETFGATSLGNYRRYRRRGGRGRGGSRGKGRDGGRMRGRGRGRDSGRQRNSASSQYGGSVDSRGKIESW